MANSLDAFIPELWANESVAILVENMVVANLIHRDFSPLVANFGDVVNTRKPAEFTAKRKVDTDDVTVRPGGILLYVTCSLLPDENHRQIDRFLGRRPDARASPIVAAWGRAAGAGRQILPGERTMDGFFYARLTRAASA